MISSFVSLARGMRAPCRCTSPRSQHAAQGRRERAAPGLGAEPGEPELIRLEVPFGEELVHYAVGPASCAVPGVPAGLDALWRAHGLLPWARLLEPALRLARTGVEMPAAHAACLEM